MSTLHFRIGTEYVGGFGDGATPPSDSVSCPAPTRGDDVWNGSAWIARVVTSAELDALADEFAQDSFQDDKKLLAMAIVLRETVKAMKTGDQSFFASVTTNEDFKDLVKSIYRGLL